MTIIGIHEACGCASAPVTDKDWVCMAMRFLWSLSLVVATTVRVARCCADRLWIGRL
jgi:hypothetical protein